MRRVAPAPSRTLMALLSGCAAALVILSVPVPLLETIVASTGVAEVVPAAAPPLGHTARTIMAGFAGVLGIGLSLALKGYPAAKSLQNRGEAGEPAKGDNTMGFALPKMRDWTRGARRKTPVSGLEAIDPMPVLRRADSHPDAPARRPIFASRDFGGVEPLAGSLAALAPEAATAEPELAAPDTSASIASAEEEVEGFAMPRAPAPLDDQTLLTDAIVAHDNSIVRLSLDGLSLEELVDRFEQGIARRKVLVQAAAASRRVKDILAETGKTPVPYAERTDARMPVLADIPPVPPVAVRSDVDKDMDAALRAALNSLQQMTGR